MEHIHLLLYLTSMDAVTYQQQPEHFRIEGQRHYVPVSYQLAQ
jgi:hypothetical protein